MRVETDDNKPTELVPLDKARQQVERLDFWSEDKMLGETELVSIPEVQKSRMGFVRGGVTYPVLDLNGLRRETGLPMKVFPEFEDNSQLLASMISHCLMKRREHSVRFSGHQSAVTTVTEPKGSWLSPLQVFDVVAGELGGHIEYIKMSRKGLLIKFVGAYEVSRKTGVGDVTRAGLVMQINKHIQLAAYCFRLTCSNGMMRKYEKMISTDTLDRLVSEVRNICQTEFTAAKQLTDDFLALDEQPFDGNREQTLVRLAQRTGLPSRFVDKAIRRLPELPTEGATMYDGINLLTTLAREMKRPEKVQQRIGAAVHYLRHECPRCDHCGADLQNGH